jgi:hypothetical protein
MANGRCEALKGDGTRCQARAMEGSTWCYGHDPSRAEERKRNATRGGRAGGRGRGSLLDTDQAKRHVKSLVGRLISGDVPRDVAVGAFMGINCLMRVLEQERRLVEQHELTERIEALERRQRVEQSLWQSRHKL